jgi:hypothetical protein
VVHFAAESHVDRIHRRGVWKPGGRGILHRGKPL